MPKPMLNFRFHNPNTAEKTAEYIAAIFFEVNKIKLEEIIREGLVEKRSRGRLSENYGGQKLHPIFDDKNYM